MLHPYFLIFEFGAISAFLAVLWHERKDWKALEVLSLAFVYGMFLEALNIRMSQGIYSYDPVFLLEIAGVPLCIGAGWAIVFYLSQNAAERFGLAWWQSPFLMALAALSYDLAMDAVAIRLGFWHWSIPLDEEWFGVPYDNFFGWLAVVWTFALIVNLSFRDFVRENYRRIIRYSAPVISALLLGFQIMVYVNLSAVLSGRYSLGEALSLYGQGEYSFAYAPEVQEAKAWLLLFIILSLSVSSWTWIRKGAGVRGSKDGFALAISSLVHLMFLSFLFFGGIYEVSPLLVLVSLLVFGSDVVLETGRIPFRKDERRPGRLGASSRAQLTKKRK